MSTDAPYVNGRRDYNRLLLSILGAALSVIVLAGAGWVGSIQSQVNSLSLIAANLNVSIARLETKLDFLSRENADLRIKVQELERTVVNLGGGGRRTGGGV